MTGYQVIKFHFENFKTRPRMRNIANKVKNPTNPSTGNIFFGIYWGKWTRTGAVISFRCLWTIDLRSLRLHFTITHSSTFSGLRFALFSVTVFPAAENKFQFELFCNHIIVWSYCGFKKKNCDYVNDENDTTGLHKLCQPASLAVGKWRENEKMNRTWRENEEMERKWRENEEIERDSFFLRPSLSMSSIKICPILSQNVMYGTFVVNVAKN